MRPLFKHSQVGLTKPPLFLFCTQVYLILGLLSFLFLRTLYFELDVDTEIQQVSRLCIACCACAVQHGFPSLFGAHTHALLHIRTQIYTLLVAQGLPGLLSMATNFVPASKAIFQRCREAVTGYVSDGRLPDFLQPQVRFCVQHTCVDACACVSIWVCVAGC